MAAGLGIQPPASKTGRGAAGKLGCEGGRLIGGGAHPGPAGGGPNLPGPPKGGGPPPQFCASGSA